MNFQDTSKSLMDAVAKILAPVTTEEVEVSAAETTEEVVLTEAIKVKTHKGMYSIKKGEESLKSWVEKIVIMSDDVKKSQRKTITQNIVKAIESGKIKNADLTQGLGALIGVKSPKGMEAPSAIVKAELKSLGLLESVDLKEALKPSNGKSTIGLEVMEPERALKDMKKFKLKGKQGKGRNSNEVIVTGKNADIFKYLRSAYYGLDADEIEEFHPELFESVDLEEAIKWWTVTITKKAGKLFKGQTVDVKASNSAQAIKKGLKQMKADPMTVPSGSVDAVLGESRDMDFEKTNVLTYDEYDEVKNFRNFNKKDWKRNAIQKKYVRIKPIKEAADLEEAAKPFKQLEKDWIRAKGNDKKREKLIKRHDLKPLISNVRAGAIKLGPLNNLNMKDGNHTMAGLDADGELIFISNNPTRIHYPSNTKDRPKGEEMKEENSMTHQRLLRVVEVALGERPENTNEFIKESNIDLTMTPSSIQKSYKQFNINR